MYLFILHNNDLAWKFLVVSEFLEVWKFFFRCSPPCVVEEQRDIQAYGKPLLSTQEHDTEESMDRVLWKHQLERTQISKSVLFLVNQVGRQCSDSGLMHAGWPMGLKSF